MSSLISKQLLQASVKRINQEFPVGCCMRDKQTGFVYVRGLEMSGGRFAVMSLMPQPQKEIVAAKLFELRFEPEDDHA